MPQVTSNLPIPEHIVAALDAIYAGSTADSEETAILEFKEDPSRTPCSKNPRAELIQKLTDEAICLANGDAAGGHIVVGVADKKSGPAAFAGTDFDEDEVVRKIFNNTTPQLRVEASVHYRCGARLLLIRVPEAVAFYSRKNGQASRRRGASCEPVSEEIRRAIVAARANPDFSNGQSLLDVSSLRLDNLNEGRRLLKEARQKSGIDPAVPETPRGFLRELGLVNDNGDLKRAVDMLFGDVPPAQVTVRHLWRSLPGGQPKVTEFCTPIVVALPAVLRVVGESASQEIDRICFDNGQEAAIPRFPLQAVDEVITNAFIHRDWRLSGPIVIDQSPRVLKVWSPGSLPEGVDVSRLLTTQSIPRNNRLMAAMRTMKLAEESSRGFDRMWAAMLSTGRNAPEVIVNDSSVEVILSSGQPDVSFMQAMHRLRGAFGDEVAANVNVLIVMWHLWDAPILTLKVAMEKMQATRLETAEFLDSLVALDVLGTVRDAEEWVLTSRTRSLLGLTDPGTLASVSIQEWIEARLADGVALGAAEISEVTGISRKEATEHLRHLRTLGRAQIDPEGPSRGRGTRWVKP